MRFRISEVIREKEFIEVHTVDDNDGREREKDQKRHCEGCQCLVNPVGVFESDLAKKIKMEQVKLSGSAVILMIIRADVAWSQHQIIWKDSES